MTLPPPQRGSAPDGLTERVFHATYPRSSSSFSAVLGRSFEH
jgi:hypothetical protein